MADIVNKVYTPAVQLCSASWGGNVPGTVYGPKKITYHESRMSKFHFSFRVKISLCKVWFFILLLRKQ